MTHITSHGFHTFDSFEHMTWFIILCYNGLTGYGSDSYESSDGFHTMTHYES